MRRSAFGENEVEPEDEPEFADDSSGNNLEYDFVFESENARVFLPPTRQQFKVLKSGDRSDSRSGEPLKIAAGRI